MLSPWWRPRGGVAFGAKMQQAPRFWRGRSRIDLVPFSATFLDPAHVLVEHHWGAAFGRPPWGPAPSPGGHQSSLRLWGPPGWPGGRRPLGGSQPGMPASRAFRPKVRTTEQYCEIPRLLIFGQYTSFLRRNGPPVFAGFPGGGGLRGNRQASPNPVFRKQGSRYCSPGEHRLLKTGFARFLVRRTPSSENGVRQASGRPRQARHGGRRPPGGSQAGMPASRAFRPEVHTTEHHCEIHRG